jgi:hypothetical protein
MGAVYIGEAVTKRAIPGLGKAAVGPLCRRFRPQGGFADARRLEALVAIAGADAKDTIIRALREGKPEIREMAFDAVADSAWYLHRTPEGKHYFDRQENLTKLLQSLAGDAPEAKIDELIRHRPVEMFKPTRKAAYGEVLPLPEIDQSVDRVRK